MCIDENTGLGMPAREYREKLYEIYCHLYGMKHSSLGENDFLHLKQRKMLDSIFGYESWSWRVVGISKKALDRVANKKPPFENVKGIQRDHFILSREKIHERMYARRVVGNEIKPLPFKEWWCDVFWKNDQTLLVTWEENIKKSEKKSKVLCFADLQDWEDWRHRYFPSDQSAGVRYRPEIEERFLRELHARDKRGELENIWQDTRDNLKARLSENPSD
ncbi:MAG: hypothetical protein MJE68_16435 [Proteobacteria bacterium]|nr:hypothetical protein [Pseudomonadota bacterium]